MAMTKCPECGGEVSAQAVVCPHCGYPLKNDEDEYILNTGNPTGNRFTGLLKVLAWLT